CSIDGSYYGDREMLDTEISKNPRRENYNGLEKNVFVSFPSIRRDMEECSIRNYSIGRKNDEWQKEQ
ncbi:MAG: hypothetical protein II570_08885, partial [Bacteroidaceae bacterium]|nr:hypothetical protein [Bacteroidaceae bacterium]